MKFTVKFDTRKLNKMFGDLVADVKYICERERTLVNADGPALSAMIKAGFAKVTCKGPGWPLQVTVFFDEMEKAGIVKEWNIA